MSNGLINPTQVFHIATGMTIMNAVDARNAVSNHRLEWSLEPWTPEVLERAKAAVVRDQELSAVPIIGALKTEEKK